MRMGAFVYEDFYSFCYGYNNLKNRKSANIRLFDRWTAFSRKKNKFTYIFSEFQIKQERKNEKEK